MRHEEDRFTTHDGLDLYRQSWLPEGKARANLIFVHGVGEHSGRYANLVAWFGPKGYALHGFDHRGHGKSPGPRGHIMAWDEFREDVRVFVQAIDCLYPGVPTVLLGHSMGGLIVLDYGLHYGAGLKALIASAPPLAQSEDISPVILFLARLLSSIAPALTMKTGLSADGLSRDGAVVQAYREDPLVHGLATPRFGAEMQRVMKTTMAGAPRWPVDLPLCIVHGGADRICPPVGSLRFFENATAQNKTRFEYPDFRHEVFNELGKEQVFSDIEVWLERLL